MSTLVDLKRSRPSRTTLVAGVIVLILLSGCGDAPAGDASSGEVSGSTNTPGDDAEPADGGLPETTDSDPEPGPVLEPDPVVEPAPDLEPESAYPPSAVPIANTHELSQPAVWSIQTGGQVYFLHDAALSRVTPGSDSVEFLDLALDFEFVSWWMGATDDHVLISGSDLSLAAANILVVVDISTFEVSGVEMGASTEWRLTTAHRGGSSLPVQWGSTQDVWFSFDPATMTRGDLISFGTDQANFFPVDDEWWEISDSGSVQIFGFDDYERRGEFDFGNPVGQWTVGAVTFDDSSVWLKEDTEGIVRRVDRTTLAVSETIAMGERYGDGTWFGIRASNGGYSLAVVDHDGGRWHVLFQLDPSTGEVVFEHAIAPAEDSYWGPQWLYFPEVQVAEGRLYVLDHPQRVIEVDLARLGHDDTGEWVDPGLPTPAG